MKNIHRLLVVLVFISLSFACKKDHSNTELIQLPDFYIDTIGKATYFEVLQSLEEVIIDPEISFAGNPADLSYLWRLYNPSTNYDPDRGAPQTLIDTLGEDRQLKAFIRRNPGTYTAELRVTDTKLGVQELMRYTVVVRASTPYGWLVAYDAPTGGTDVALIRTNDFVQTETDESVLYDIYSSSNGETLPGSALRLSGTGTMIVTDQTAVRVARSDFSKTLDFEQLFMGGAPNPKPEGVLDQGQSVFINDGSAYLSYNNVYISRINADDKGYRASPIPIRVMYSAAGVFDDLNKRFFSIQQENNNAVFFSKPAANAQFDLDLNYINKQFLYCGEGSTRSPYESYGSIVQVPNQYAFFRELDGSKTWLYGINFLNALDPGVCMIDMSGLMGIHTARYFQIGSLATMGIYATERNVYSFTFDVNLNTAQDNKLGFTVPANEVITAMSLFNATGNGYSGSDTKRNRILFVATWDEVTKDGKVYLLPVDPLSGNVSGQPSRMLSGFGKIKDMILKTS